MTRISSEESIKLPESREELLRHLIAGEILARRDENGPLARPWAKLSAGQKMNRKFGKKTG